MRKKRFAVFGNPIHHSYSPQMHQLFAQQCDIDIEYDKVLVPMDGFQQAVTSFFAQGGIGLNVTVPFKLEAFTLAEAHLTERARIAGAVNTLWMEQGQLHGDNTDGIGLVKDLQGLGINLNQKRILIIGAGGATRGILFPLLSAGCTHLHIANRTEDKAHKLIEPLKERYPSQLSASNLSSIQGQWDIIINASASSLDNRPPNIPHSIFSQAQFAYDLVYTSTGMTAFLELAKTQEVTQCADGLGMLVYQGAESFSIWNKQFPNVAPIISSLRLSLS